MSIVAYHGTNSRFAEFDERKARVANDLYGGGIAYFTDNMEVAKSYATSMFKKYGGERYVYQVKLSLSNIFDVNTVFWGDDLLKLTRNSNTEMFARSARLLPLGADRVRILSALKNGEIDLTGEQVFRGLSYGGVNSAEARRRIIAAGYDGLRYNGGEAMNMATKHNVYLAYRAISIRIDKRFIISKNPISPTERQIVYSYI